MREEGLSQNKIKLKGKKGQDWGMELMQKPCV